MSDVIETPLPRSVRNHWWWRQGWAEGRHFYACHMTLDDQAQLRDLVAGYQKVLTSMQGIDLVPPQWLHMTMQGIGFTDEIAAGELVALGHALTARLAAIEPPAAGFRYLTIHPEAVYLKAHPAAVLYPLRLKMHDAVLSVLGPERFTEPAPDRAKFLPHVSIGYINRDGEAEPIAAALSRLTTRNVEITFTKAELLEFHRDNRMYEWTSVTPIPIGGLATSRNTSRPAVTLLFLSSGSSGQPRGRPVTRLATDHRRSPGT